VGSTRKKRKILNTLDKLDKKTETEPLQLHEIDYKQFLNNRLAELLREEKSNGINELK
jgi:hypothetical protein